MRVVEDRCAQRLSASPPEGTRTRRALPHGCRRSAQRLSASPPEGTGDHQDVLLLLVLLLNAFRHHRQTELSDPPRPRCSISRAQRLSASPPEGTRHANAMSCVGCSTPFGITARGNASVQEQASSASQCSTPFGITARGNTRQGHPLGQRERVLNAFRHHRQRERTQGPQRRSAGRVCSTPFGITARGNCVGHHVEREERRVLNAFRHHRQREQMPSGRARRSEGVLNAFRHHRQREHLQHSYARSSHPVCSTPFGITARGNITIEGGPTP